MQHGFCRDVFLIFYWNIWIKFPQNIDLIVEIMPLKKPLEQSDTLHLYTVHGVFFYYLFFLITSCLNKISLFLSWCVVYEQKKVYLHWGF